MVKRTRILKKRCDYDKYNNFMTSLNNKLNKHKIMSRFITIETVGSVEIYNEQDLPKYHIPVMQCVYSRPYDRFKHIITLTLPDDQKPFKLVSGLGHVIEWDGKDLLLTNRRVHNV